MHKEEINFSLYNQNKISCTIEGLISDDFVEKNIQGRQLFQSKVYSNNKFFYDSIINFINKIDPSTINAYPSFSILLNFWHTDIFFKYQKYLKKGTKIKAEGVMGFKVYKRNYGEERLYLFFAVNKITEIKNENTSHDTPINSNSYLKTI